MRYEWLEYLKEDARIDGNGQDGQLTRLLAAAEASVLRDLGVTREELQELNGGDYPDDVVHAIIILARHFYDDGEAVIQANRMVNPYGIDRLISKYRNLL